MQKLVKLFLLAALLVATKHSYAQINFGVKAGLNLANVMTDEDLVNPKILPTFQVGVLVDFGITEKLAVETGISFQGKGFKLEDDILGQSVKTTAAPYYLQVPAHIMFRTSSFFVGVGPYVGLGIAGKIKSEAAGQSDSQTIQFGNTEDDDWAPLDFGLGIQAGVNVGSIRIGAGYDFGLSDLVPKDARNDSSHTSNGVINVFGAFIF